MLFSFFSYAPFLLFSLLSVMHQRESTTICDLTTFEFYIYVKNRLLIGSIFMRFPFVDPDFPHLFIKKYTRKEKVTEKSLYILLFFGVSSPWPCRQINHTCLHQSSPLVLNNLILLPLPRCTAHSTTNALATQKNTLHTESKKSNIFMKSNSPSPTE